MAIIALNALFQTRSETKGISNETTLFRALEAAKKDRTIWKISFNAANGDRVRLVTHDNGITWILEPLWTHVSSHQPTTQGDNQS